MIRVMITGCSKHSKDIIDCLRNNKDGVSVEIVGVDMNEKNLLRHEIDLGYVVPPITDERYIRTLEHICETDHVDIIFPYITAELMLLSEAKEGFERIGTKVSVASPKTISMLNDKANIYRKYHKVMPKQVEVRNVGELAAALDRLKWPEQSVCCKLPANCGGTGFCILDENKCYDITQFNRRGVNRYIGYSELFELIGHADSNVILQRYLPGTNYSVSVLADHGKVLQAVGYAGYDMEYGAVIDGEIIQNKEAIDIAKEIVKDSKLDGNACFDFILLDDNLKYSRAKLLECNPRINASLGFINAAGANLVWMRCRQLMGEEAETSMPIREGLKMQKYYESEYYV